MVKNFKVQRGDIFYADLGRGVGSEQGCQRPVVVVQNNTGNGHSPTVIVAPMTSIFKKKLPTHVIVPQFGRLRQDSIIMSEQIRVVDKTRLSGYIGHVSSDILSRIDMALAISLGLAS